MLFEVVRRRAWLYATTAAMGYMFRLRHRPLVGYTDSQLLTGPPVSPRPRSAISRETRTVDQNADAPHGMPFLATDVAIEPALATATNTAPGVTRFTPREPVNRMD
jgi:hypothetical protein